MGEPALLPENVALRALEQSFGMKVIHSMCFMLISVASPDLNAARGELLSYSLSASTTYFAPPPGAVAAPFQRHRCRRAALTFPVMAPIAQDLLLKVIMQVVEIIPDVG